MAIDRERRGQNGWFALAFRNLVDCRWGGRRGWL